MDFDPNDVTDEKTFWKQMGQLLEESSACSDCASFTRLAAYWMTRERKQLYVIVYGLEFLLENTEFATRFMDILSDWRTCSWFCGFLGVGSHSVIRQCAQLTGDKLSHLFDASNVISPTPFSLEQMESFFNAAESCCAFSESLRCGTIQHSRGAPGEFAALIRFTDMNEKEKEERREWERWLKLRAFRKYLVDSEETHLETHAGLGGSGTTKWEVVRFILENDGCVTSEEVVSWCAACVGMEGGRDFIDSLLNMGAVTQDKKGVLAITSDVVYRLCLEAYPVRKVSQIEDFDDLTELLAIALQHVDPVMLSKRLVKNRRRIQHVFHHELFPILRGIRASHGRLSLPLSMGCGRCADIFLGDCSRTAFEFVANCVSEANIVACVA